MRCPLQANQPAFTSSVICGESACGFWVQHTFGDKWHIQGCAISVFAQAVAMLALNVKPDTRQKEKDENDD